MKNRMKKLGLIVVVLFVLVSCEKDKIESSIAQSQPPKSYLLTDAGSYAVYKWYKIQADGTEIDMNLIDTVKVVGSEEIDGKTFVKIDQTYLGNNSIEFLRDSSGNIINSMHEIQYSYTKFSSDFNHSSLGDWSWTFHMNSNALSCAVPAGTFTTYERIQTIESISGNSVNTCNESSVQLHTFYNNDIGIVKEQMVFLGNLQTDCSKMERRLISFFITE